MMAATTMVNTETDKSMAKESIIGLTALNTQANGKVTRCMEQESSYGPTVGSTKGPS